MFPAPAIMVALRKESVDRNLEGVSVLHKITVALRKESVDRNQIFPLTWTLTTQSLSARRAWIEMYNATNQTWLLNVALRKESVDRNACCGWL